ncbi:hypothetical protein SteCoe_22064 [Stentor coeruleus]|uniref:26S proteasome non-ATPase regulatory subunit 5 n=1 Tax=Stentor coeruleus TaxID=5963 RepID=A0A1R2BMY1_9CILI|nr:hypothetical protein SteCoe_22064 [Stentor coeruleus]
MEEFLSNPTELTAQNLLRAGPLTQILSAISSNDDKISVLSHLSQLNHFNIINQIGIDSLISLLNQVPLQKVILEHLKCIEFPIQDYSSLIHKLFAIFVSEPITESSLCKDILVHKFSMQISQLSYLNTLKDILNSSDSILKVRGFELVIELANTSDFSFYDNSGLIDTGISMATGNDLLLRLVVIEVIAELGNSEPGCKKLLGNNINNIIQQAIEDDSDPHTRNKLIVLAGKIFHFTGNENLMTNTFWSCLIRLLGSDDPASVKNSLNVLEYISTRPNGITKIFSNNQIIGNWGRLQKSVNSSVKAHFYHSFYHILNLCTEDHINAYLRVNNIIQPMIDELVNPFQNSHYDILKCIGLLVKWRNQAVNFLANEKFKVFLFKRPPHQMHEISYLKYDIVTELNKHDLPQGTKNLLEKYLKAGVFAGESEMEMELESLN